MSNTEQMVSVPRELAERIKKTCMFTMLEADYDELRVALGKPAAQHKGDPDRALKDALFACLAAGGDDREYGGVATAGDRQGWARFTTVASGAQHQGEPVALPARKQWGGLLPTAENLRTEGWNAYNEEMAKLGPLYAHPAPVQQGEPVAWVIFENGFIDDHTTDKDLADGWREQGLEVSALYTHPAAGEVKQGYHNSVVEGLVSRQNELREERDTLRAELESVKSSRDAFAQNAIDLRAELAECEKDRKRLRDNNVERIDEVASYQARLAEREALLSKRGTLLGLARRALKGWANSGPVIDQIDAALSASAEPKCQDGGMCADSSHKCTGCARDERDERALFESAHVAKCFNFNRKTVLGMLGEYGNPYVQSTWEGWQARAALERKP